VTLTVQAATASIPNGTISSYQWSQIENGANVTLNGAQTATASFVAPAVTTDTMFKFQLTVTDSVGDDNREHHGQWESISTRS
jgi:chitinase